MRIHHAPRFLSALISMAGVIAAGEPRPRVLLVGDSISIGYTRPVTAALKGVAEVVHHPGNAETSRNAVERMSGWLGTGPWAVVHLNVGLWDVARDTGPGVAVPLDEYVANLRKLIELARATKARVVFATTTPVPPVNGRKRRQEDVEAYNRAALALMAELKVDIDDLHAVAFPERERLWINRADVHFRKTGYETLAAAVATAVRTALATPAVP